MHSSWKLKLLTVKYNQFPPGSIITVGEDIPEGQACYLLQCNVAVPVDDDLDEITIGGKSEEKLHSNDDYTADIITDICS